MRVLGSLLFLLTSFFWIPRYLVPLSWRTQTLGTSHRTKEFLGGAPGCSLPDTASVVEKVQGCHVRSVKAKYLESFMVAEGKKNKN